MPDPYATIAKIDAAMQSVLADAIETRATEPAQIAMRRDYLSEVPQPEGARAADFGSGTGHLARDLVEVLGCAQALGLDPSPVMVERARSLHDDVPGLSFAEGDARDTGLPAGSLDLVVFHTVLCHVPEPERAVAEAFRVLRPGGTVAVFDGDYDTATVAIRANDPLEALVRGFIDTHVHDLWLTRRLAPLLADAGFTPGQPRAHPYMAEGEAPYFQTIVARGADQLAATGDAGPEAAEALKAEAHRRIAEGRFFGFISFISLLGTKPAA